MKRIRTFFILAVSLLSLTVTAFASGINTEQKTAANYLHMAGIMIGGTNGDMMLEQGLTRAQMATVLTRVIANPEHVEADSVYYRKQCKFSDVPDWAKVYVGYCTANHLVAGYGNGLYGPNDPVTPAAACTVMLRCFGDVGTDWSYTTACQTAIELGLAPADALAGTEITRGNMAVLIYRTMAQLGYDVETPDAKQPAEESGLAISYNADGSINVPADGARYVPQIGDIIRCDDGSNYAITDVSRYDKNMFAAGPVGDMPEPTCDWSSFPEVELPEAEVRRYKTESGDYLFVRNLYESLRMQYTLQNLAGNHPDTSEDGKLKYGAKGTPLVRIKLTINDDLTPQVFWPWRDSELENLFNSCPPGTYSVECWDVYKDGVFQRTEYKVYVI